MNVRKVKAELFTWWTGKVDRIDAKGRQRERERLTRLTRKVDTVGANG